MSVCCNNNNNNNNNSKWINNCVGFQNHKYFIQTLVLAWIGCVAVVAISVVRVVLKPFEIDVGGERAVLVRELAYLVIFALTNLSALLQLLFITGMALFHFHLIAHNMTNVEYNCCGGKAPGCRFDRGRLFNLKEVLGPNYALWWLPVYTPPQRLDGDNFMPPLPPPPPPPLQVTSNLLPTTQRTKSIAGEGRGKRPYVAASSKCSLSPANAALPLD